MAYVFNIGFVVSGSPVKGVPNMINVDMSSGSGGKFMYPLPNVLVLEISEVGAARFRLF